MKKIIVVRPVSLNFRGGSIFLKPKQIHLVEDEVAGHPYLKSFIKSVEDVVEDKPVKKTAKKKAKK